jgi:hypothetical protein
MPHHGDGDRACNHAGGEVTEGLDEPADYTTERGTRGHRRVMDDVARPVETEVVDAMHQDAAANPDHGRSPHDSQADEEIWHAHDDGPAHGPRWTIPFTIPRHPQAEVVRLHDQGHGAINGDGYADRHKQQHNGLGDETLAGQLVQCDGHDLSRQDEVGLDGAADLGFLERLGVDGRWLECGFMLMRSLGGKDVPDLLDAFVAEIGTPQNQQGRNRPRQNGAQEQGGRQQEQELVLYRAFGDSRDDGQLAIR